MISFVSTPGAEDATSYSDVSAANNYIHFYSDTQGVELWNNLTEERKEIFLMRATAEIDRSFAFIGTPASTGQVLQWPRQGVPTGGYRSPSTELLGTSVIPEDIRISTALLAIEIHKTELYQATQQDEADKPETLPVCVRKRLEGWGKERAHPSTTPVLAWGRR